MNRKELKRHYDIRIHPRVPRAALSTVTALFAATVLASSAQAGMPARTAAQPKLILFELSFPCGLNDYASQLCAGVKKAAKVVAPTYKVEIKTGVNFSDTTAFNGLIQTSEQLSPSGLIIFPPGAATETPTLNRACAKGIKLVIIDSPATGLKCESGFIGAPHYDMGVADAKWLIAHPPANGSKQVAIVTFPRGETPSNDLRVEGFTKTVTAAGYKIVATVDASNDIPTTAGAVTNMVTAHPDLGAIFSANGPMGDGTEEALKNNHAIVQLSEDGFLTDMSFVKDGQISADTAQDPYREGVDAVEDAANAIAGRKVPKLTYTPIEVVSRANVDAYVKAGGLH
jgi:ribose transport system substrate-binding protein